MTIYWCPQGQFWTTNREKCGGDPQELDLGNEWETTQKVADLMNAVSLAHSFIIDGEPQMALDELDKIHEEIARWELGQ
jgi:hypothetical protein